MNAWPSSVLIGAEKIFSLERFYADFYPSGWGRHPTLQEFASTLSWDAGHRLDDAFAYHDLPVVPEAQDEHEYLCALTHFLRKDYEGMQQYLTRLSACEHAAIAQRALILSLFAIPNTPAGREQRDQLLQHVGTPQSVEEKLFHTLVAAWSAREKEFAPTLVLEILARQELPTVDTASDPRQSGAHAVLIGLYTSLYAAASYNGKASEFREVNRKIARPHQLTSYLSYVGLELSEKAGPILGALLTLGSRLLFFFLLTVVFLPKIGV